MSLLIKALQKAEQSKETASAEKSATPADLTLELTPHTPSTSEISLAEESGFDVPLHAAPKTTPAPIPKPVVTAKPEPKAEREAAANVFQAKTAVVADPGGRRAFWLGLGGLVLLLLLGGGFYFYLETLLPPEVAVVRPMPAPTPIATTTAATPSPEPTPVAAAPTEPEPAVAPSANANQPTTETAAVPTKPASAPIPTPPAEKAATPDNESVKVTRSRKAEPASNATATSAYQAFMASDDASAGRLYRQLLQAEPRNVDALLGLAAVAARQDDMDEAARHYAKALELEPKNSVAQAGLIALMSQADPVAAESRLKSLLAQQSDAAYLHAALGGVYAEQNRWPDAQQSYFQAFRLEPTNAEHAYNLAISLDQMGKADLALDYYQRCRDLLPKQGSSVDRAALESRINQLHK
jgi:Flp pilus assembly protein TadD